MPTAEGALNRAIYDKAGPLPEGWSSGHWRGMLPHIERSWPYDYRRRDSRGGTAYVRPDGSCSFTLSAGPCQEVPYWSCRCESTAAAVDFAIEAMARWIETGVKPEVPRG